MSAGSSLHSVYHGPLGIAVYNPSLSLLSSSLYTQSLSLVEVEDFVFSVEQISIRLRRQTCYVTFKSPSHAGPQSLHPVTQEEPQTLGRLPIPALSGEATHSRLLLHLSPAEIQVHYNGISSPFFCIWHLLKSFNYLKADPSCQ